MTPSIQTTNEKKLVGKRLIMRLDDDRVRELWKSFMPRRKEIKNNLTTDLISVAVYPPKYFSDFKATNEFERWAAAEVLDFDNVPNGMETFVVPSGLYAVFEYKGLNSDTSVFQYILGTWLPGSDYLLDDRPHFEVLGEKYQNNDPASEEQIWIPIRWKNTHQ
ncbi:MAG: GyrI-like domain-containing protein [Saprospiraceae bacterium]